MDHRCISLAISVLVTVLGFCSNITCLIHFFFKKKFISSLLVFNEELANGKGLDRGSAKLLLAQGPVTGDGLLVFSLL